MSSPKQPFSDPTLKNNLENVTSASVVIQLYTQMILQQSDISLSALPNLPRHQKLARKNATSWNETILPSMAKTTADIIDYANTFQSFYGVLVSYAKDIANPDSKNKLVEGLQLLHTQVQTKTESTQAVIKLLTTFHEALTVDNQNLQADYKVAEVKIAGDDGEIKSLGDQLDAVHAAMHKDIGFMAGGAVAIVAGVALMVVGIALEIPTAGVSTALVGGGILLLAGGAVLETLGASDYVKQMKLQKTINEQLAKDKQEMTSLKSIKNTIDNFLNALGSAIQAAQVLVASWNALALDLSNVISAIDRVDPTITSSFIVAELDAANKDWAVALDKAKQLQPNGHVPIKVYKDLQNAFKDAKPQG